MNAIQLWVNWAGAVAIAVLIIVVWIGFARGQRRAKGQASGAGLRFTRLPLWAYLLMILVYIILCYLLWRSIPLSLSPAARIASLIVGSVLYFPSLGLIFWARYTLGEMYNISLTTGAELYAGHHLITRGPFSIVRHPMYTGAILAVVGALLIYRTWTIVFILAHCLVFFARARREEQALSAEFGDEWIEYASRVPRWIPRWSPRKPLADAKISRCRVDSTVQAVIRAGACTLGPRKASSTPGQVDLDQRTSWRSSGHGPGCPLTW